MKKSIAIAAILLLLICGCKQIGPCPPMKVLGDGTYTGTFHRLTMKKPGAYSHITLQLSNGHFNGSSDSLYYPGICNGSFTKSDSTITFENSCFWPAIADLIIVQGSYNFYVQGDSIELVSLKAGTEIADILTLHRTN